jgi:hypothetical protein
VYNSDVLITGTVVANGLVTINGNLTIDTVGVLIHDETSDKSKTISLVVSGRVTVVGIISATQRSSLSSGKYWTSYGGEALDQNQADSSAVYGDFRNPTDMGRASRYGHKGGGLISIKAGSLQLDGTIEAPILALH